MTDKKPVKVIFDTNIWISYLIGYQLAELTPLLYSGKIQLVFTDQLLEEFRDVSGREKFRRYFKEEKVNELLVLMRILGVNYPVAKSPEICRDPKDNFLLGLIQSSEADLLVTGDQDLLSLKTFAGASIIEPSDLKAHLDALAK